MIFAQLQRFADWSADIIDNHGTVIMLVSSTLLCLVLSGMFVLWQWIRTQEDPHKNCKGKARKEGLILANGELFILQIHFEAKKLDQE